MIPNIKMIATTILLTVLIGSYYFFHHLPIKQLLIDVEDLKVSVKSKNVTISNLNAKLLACKEDAKRDGFVQYIEGLSNEVNDTNYPKFTF